MRGRDCGPDTRKPFDLVRSRRPGDHKPAWWPENEPWPPRDEMYRWRTGRRRFFRRAAAFGFAAMALMFVGLFAVIWFAAASVKSGPSSASQTVLVVVVGFVPFALIAIAMARMRGAVSSLRRVMDAADRVAAGHYETRVAEVGPYSPFRNLARSFNTMTERLQRNERQRRDLMADVAHELRTPLTIIQGRLEGIVDGVYPSDTGQLEMLVEQTHVLSRLIDDLQTLALSESGALTLSKETVDPGELARDAVRAFTAGASERSVRLDVEVAGNVPAIGIDPVRIREVLSNLLSNAVRHTPSGGAVTVRVESKTMKDVAVSVSDTGRGMTVEQSQRAFERFSKGSDSSGSGLGLTIAKNLVEAHGGEIRVSSDPDRGTTVTFSLPVT